MDSAKLAKLILTLDHLIEAITPACTPRSNTIADWESAPTEAEVLHPLHWWEDQAIHLIVTSGLLARSALGNGHPVVVRECSDWDADGDAKIRQHIAYGPSGSPVSCASIVFHEDELYIPQLNAKLRAVYNEWRRLAEIEIVSHGNEVPTDAVASRPVRKATLEEVEKEFSSQLVNEEQRDRLSSMSIGELASHFNTHKTTIRRSRAFALLARYRGPAHRGRTIQNLGSGEYIAPSDAAPSRGLRRVRER